MTSKRTSARLAEARRREQPGEQELAAAMRTLGAAATRKRARTLVPPTVEEQARSLLLAASQSPPDSPLGRAFAAAAALEKERTDVLGAPGSQQGHQTSAGDASSSLSNDIKALAQQLQELQQQLKANPAPVLPALQDPGLRTLAEAAVDTIKDNPAAGEIGAQQQ